MKSCFSILWCVVLLSCASPKYTYNFDQYRYGKHNASATDPIPAVIVGIDAAQLTGSTSHTLSTSGVRSNDNVVIEKPAVTRKAYDKRAFKKELKKQTKTFRKAKISTNGVNVLHSAKQLDDELKLAIIFGAVGITLTILGGISAVFWVLGVIGLGIGLFFFIRWISRQ